MSKIFICFIGIDGSGKSTLASKIFEKIRLRDKKVRKTYGRHLPLLTKFLILVGRHLFLKNVDMFQDSDKYLAEKKRIFAKTSRLANLYISLIILECYLEIIFKIVIPLKLGYSIVSDRYVYDTIISDIAVDLDFSIKNVNELLKTFWRFIPKPDVTFLVQVPEEVCMKRKNDIPSLNYLKMRSRLYNELTTSEKIVVLDGTMDLLELENMAYKEISKIVK